MHMGRGILIGFILASLSWGPVVVRAEGFADASQEAWSAPGVEVTPPSLTLPSSQDPDPAESGLTMPAESGESVVDSGAGQEPEPEPASQQVSPPVFEPVVEAPRKPPTASRCVAAIDNQCVLHTSYQVLEFGFHQERGIVLALKIGAGEESANPYERKIIESQIWLQEDLMKRIDAHDMTDDDAITIIGDMEQIEGTYYEIPKLRDLKLELGFPEDTQFAPEDLRELVRAHLQISIGVGPLTAAYLCDRLEVRRVKIEPAAPETPSAEVIHLVAE